MIFGRKRVPVLRLALASYLLVAPFVSTSTTMGHPATAPIEIRVAGGWSDVVQAPAFAKLVEGYNSVQSAVHVTAIKAVGDAQVLTEVAAGKAPDVFVNFNASDVAPWGIAGYALNLDPYIKATHYDTSQLIPAARKLSTYNGHFYAIPTLVDTTMLLYNKTLFQQAGISAPPKTIEELTADAAKLTKKDSSGHLTQLGFDPLLYAGDYNGTWFPAYVAMFGGQLASADGKKITANCAACVTAMQWEANLYKSVGATEIDRFESGAAAAEYSASNLFLTGKVAMILDGEFYTQVTTNYGPKNFNWGNAPLPYPAAHPELAGSGVDFGNPTMIIKGTKDPLAAFKVLAYMQSVKPLVAFANIVRNVPQINGALQSPNLTTDPRFRNFIKWAQGPKITVFPVLPISAAYMADLVRYETLVVHGKMSASDALNKVTSDMQTQLDAQSNGL